MKENIKINCSKDLVNYYLKYYEQLGYKCDKQIGKSFSVSLLFTIVDINKYHQQINNVKPLKANISFLFILIPSLIAIVLLTIYLIMFITKINAFSSFYYLMLPALVLILFASIMSVIKFFFTLHNYKILSSIK